VVNGGNEDVVVMIEESGKRLLRCSVRRLRPVSADFVLVVAPIASFDSCADLHLLLASAFDSVASLSPASHSPWSLVIPPCLPTSNKSKRAHTYTAYRNSLPSKCFLPPWAE
jgi:hypothetical protein